MSRVEKLLSELRSEEACFTTQPDSQWRVDLGMQNGNSFNVALYKLARDRSKGINVKTIEGKDELNLKLTEQEASDLKDRDAYNYFARKLPGSNGNYYGITAYRDGFNFPISENLEPLSEDDPKHVGIVASLQYLVKRKGLKIRIDPSQSIFTGPDDHHRPNHTTVNVFKIKQPSRFDSIKASLRGRTEIEKSNNSIVQDRR